MKRSEKFIELSKSVPYSKEELKLLRNILDKDMIKEGGMIDHDLFDLYDMVEEILSYGGYHIDRESDSEEHSHFKKLNFLQFLLVYFQKIFLFLTCIPVKETPLYIINNQFKSFVQWRLLINK